MVKSRDLSTRGWRAVVILVVFSLVGSTGFVAAPGYAQEAVFVDGFELGNLCAWSLTVEDLEASVAISTNPSVEQFLEISTSCGDLYYQGSRDVNGLVTAIERIFYEVVGKVYRIDLDDQGRPIRMFDEVLGTSFELEWLTESQVSVTAVSHDGEVQVTVLVDLAEPASTSTTDVELSKLRARSPDTRVSNLEPRGGIPVRLVADPSRVTSSRSTSENGSGQAMREHELTRKATSPSVVTVERCGEPVDNASSTITVISEGRVLRVAGDSAGSGQYVHSIPTSAFETGDSLEDICSSTSTVVGNACTWVVDPIFQSGASMPICLALAGALDTLLFGPTGEGVGIFAACQASFTGAVVICQTAGASAGPGAPSALDLLCENASEAANAVAGPDVTLVAQAVIPGGGVVSVTKTASATGPYPNFFLQGAPQPSISSFVVSPPDPGPFEGYVATAGIACAPTATEVLMEVSGTDGYFDSAVCTISGEDTCSLQVPGASDGVRDTVTVSIGGTILRSTVIVF